jgi:hypothetical protein
MHAYGTQLITCFKYNKWSYNTDGTIIYQDATNQKSFKENKNHLIIENCILGILIRSNNKPISQEDLKAKLIALDNSITLKTPIPNLINKINKKLAKNKISEAIKDSSNGYKLVEL